MERLRYHLDLKAFDSLADISSDVIILTGRLIGQTVCPVLKHLPEAITNSADVNDHFREAFPESATILLRPFNRRITYHPGVSCSTVAIMSLMH